MPHWLWILCFWLAIILIVMFLALPFTVEGRERIKYNKAKYVFALLVWFGIACYIYQDQFHHTNSEPQTEQVTNSIGSKIDKSEAKEEADGAYYVDKDDDNLRYFINNDNKITAIKYVYGANPNNVTDVMNKLSTDAFQDSDLKYTKDKTDSDDFLPEGNSFNVYSPKSKKWYHVSMQRVSNDKDAKVSSFSVWSGKDDSVDDY